MNPARFDKAYYDRYYRNPATRVCSPREVQRQGDFIAAYLRHLEVPVKSVLDIGCGLGRLLAALRSAFPKARTEGVESSPYLCDAMGWEGGSLPDYPTARQYDLVICFDVLSYLEDDPAAEAIKTL
ncbi:MAG: methyltransferase domain-containing protein, partial [Gammaproteobacteria bacterium]|nr:methyltransferase domain-containing protein [Gammaproteobacteria bacterium]